MKILWLLNELPPMVAEQLNREGSNKEGWISGALSRIVREDMLSLSICYPVGSEDEIKDSEVSLASGVIPCFAYFEDRKHPERYSLLAEARFGEILKKAKPDLVHIFGTEYGHTLAMVRTINKLGESAPKMLIGIQGVIFRCGEEYTCDLPEEVVNGYTFRDIIKHDNIANQQAKFLERGEWEKEAIRNCPNITGRTDFDKSIVEGLNESARYFAMNETLRTPFYEGGWDIESCRKHVLFVSQADYSLKGFHILLEAMSDIKNKFPDVRVRVAGANICANSCLKDRIKLGSYGKYLNNLIKSYGLEGKVEFLGRLNAEEMKREYLSCHTYVCASSLENSPNSMGEAMLLGVPVVASRVGGIPSLIAEEEEGLLFEACNAEGLAEDVIRIWKDDNLALRLSQGGAHRARLTHDADVNFMRLIEIYNEILS